MAQTTKYKGTSYTLTSDIDFDGLQDVRIDDTIYTVDNNHMSARCVDAEGKIGTAYFELLVDPNAVEELGEGAADWDNATYVQLD